MKKTSTAKKWFIIAAILAFGSVISFFQINSYWADTHNFNTAWKVIGTVLGLATLYSLYKVSKNAN